MNLISVKLHTKENVVDVYIMICTLYVCVCPNVKMYLC